MWSDFYSIDEAALRIRRCSTSAWSHRFLPRITIHYGLSRSRCIFLPPPAQCNVGYRSAANIRKKF